MSKIIAKRVLEINKRINIEYASSVAEKLSDKKLMSEYMKTKSVEKSISEFKKALANFVEDKNKDKIVKNYLHKLVPAGTKGAIRGNVFNKIVFEKIESLNMNKKRFEIKKEAFCPALLTEEKPDWYIYDKKNKVALIGMNQLDLWGGGQQTNRGSKYVTEQKITSSGKIVSVVANFIELKSDKNKRYKIFDKGFKENTICYLNGLKQIIENWFNMKIK